MRKINNEVYIEKLPSAVIWGTIFITILPFFLTFLGFDFSSEKVPFDPILSQQNLPDYHFKRLGGAFSHTILEWSAFMFAFMAFVLAFTSFVVRKDPITPILGVALLCAGCMDAFHTLAADRLIPTTAPNENLIPFTWALSRLFNSLICLTAITFVLFGKKLKKKYQASGIKSIGLFFIIVAYGTIHICATTENLPNTLFPDAFFTRPWDVYPFFVFLITSFFYYKYYKKNPSPFALSLLLSTIPNLATQAHMALGSGQLFDHHFNIAHFLKIISYAVPYMGLTWSYITTNKQKEYFNQKLRNDTRSIKLEKILIETLQKISNELKSSHTTHDIYKIFLKEFCVHFHWDIGHVYFPDKEDSSLLVPGKIWYSANIKEFQLFVNITEKTNFKSGEGLPGRVLRNKKSAWITNVHKDSNYPRNKLAKDLGVKAALGIPVLYFSENDLELLAVFEFYSKKSLQKDSVLLSVLQKITAQLGIMVEKRRLELDIENKNALLESIFESHPDSLIFANTNREIMKTSSSFKQMFKYNLQELQGKKTRILYAYEEDFSKKTAKKFNIHAKEDYTAYEIEYRKKDGEIFTGETVGSLVKSKQGEVLGFLGAIRDITDKKKINMEIKKLAERLELALEASKIGVWDYDLLTNKLVWDQNTFSMYGINESQFSGSLNSWMKMIHPEDKERLVKEIQDSIKNHDSHHTKFKILNSDGKIKYIRTIAKVFRNESNRPLRMLGVNWNVTEEENYQKELQKAKEEAEHALESKSRFLANMSHEIRTPLNGVLSCTNILFDNMKNKENIKLLKTIKSCGDSLLTIINDILDFSKIEAQKMELEYHPYNLEINIKEIIELLKPKAKSSNISLTYEIDKSVPRWINSDVTRHRQILLNLLGNALKFTKNKVYVHVTAINREENIFEILTSITDNGIGMTKKDQSKLFQSFSQVDASTTRRFGGTGLGLAICHGLVQAMQGKIWVESKVNRGSTFCFTIVAEETQNQKNNKQLDLSKINPNMAQEHPLKILMAEDNSVNQMVGKKMLEKLGYHIDIVGNGIETIEALKKQHYDLIFMDQHMPEMDGVKATKIICQQWNESERPRIVALTASAFQEDKERCLKAGMDGFLSKPIKIEEIVQELAECTPKHALEKNDFLIDESAILKQYENSMDTFYNIAAECINILPTHMKEVQKSLETQDLKALKSALGHLRGIIANFHAHDLLETFLELETMKKKKVFSHLEQNFDTLDQKMQKFKIELEQFIARKAA